MDKKVIKAARYQTNEKLKIVSMVIDCIEKAYPAKVTNLKEIRGLCERSYT